MQTKGRFFYGYTIVAISFLAMMLLLGLHATFGIFFKPMTAELGWSRTLTSGAFGLSQFMFGLLGILMGGLNDRFGPRLVMTFCGLLAAIGYALMSIVQAPWQIYLFYGVMIGTGSAVYVPLLSTVARWFTRRRSMMTGIVFAGAGVGMLILPIIIERLIATPAIGWRSTFLILGIVILVVVVTTAQFLKRDPGKVGAAVDGGEAAPQEKTPSEASFTIRETLGTRQLWLFLVVLLFYGFVFFAIQVHLAPYVTDIGISPATAAGILATIGGATIVGQLGLGSLGDKLGNKPTFLIGITLLTLASLTLLVSQELWAFFVFAVFLGLAFGDCSTIESPIAAWLFGLKSHGVILGFFAFSFTIGAALGPLTFGRIFDVTGSYQTALLVSFVLAFLAVVLTLLVKRTPPRMAA